MAGAFTVELPETLMSSSVTDKCPSVSYLGLTAFTPVKCNIEYNSIEA
jgi:hypothetical protein